MLTINQTNISNNYYNNIKTNKKVATNTIISNNQLTKSATNFKGIWWTRPQNIANTQKINKIIPFRESALAQFDKVYTNYHNSLNEVSIEDIKNAVTNIEKTTYYPREKILATMQQATQFANLRSLDLVIKKLKKNDILNVGAIMHQNYLTENMFGLNRSLNYLITQKQMGSLHGEDNAVFLDKNKIEQIKNCNDSLKELKHNNYKNIKFFVLSGFEDGINFLNRNKNLEETTRELLAQKDIDEKILKETKALGIEPIIIKNEQEPTIENIYNQMRPEQMSKKELNAAIDATLFDRISEQDKRCDVKSDVIQHLDNALMVFTPESIAKNLSEIHKNIIDFNKAQGKQKEDILYILPTEKKSYNLITHQYQLVNDIPQNRISDFIDLNLMSKDSQNKTFVILDDNTISGESLTESLMDLYKYKSSLEKHNNNIIIAPIFSTEEGINAINKYIINNNRQSKDILITNQKQHKAWNENIKDENSLDLALGSTFYDFYNPYPKKPCLIFPYMAPDNNSEFAANIALLHNVNYRLTGATRGFHTDCIKSYSRDCTYIADSIKEILNSDSK